MIIEYKNIPCLVLKKLNGVYKSSSGFYHPDHIISFYLCLKGEILLYLYKDPIRMDDCWTNMTLHSFKKYCSIINEI